MAAVLAGAAEAVAAPGDPGEFLWCGPHGKGAMKALRDEKRAEAELRNSRTPPERRSRKAARRHR